MAYTFTQSESDALDAAIEYLAGAPELPFDSTLAERVAEVAVSSGFVDANLEFLQRVKDKPITTLLEFISFVGAP